jgi:repressor LexA
VPRDTLTERQARILAYLMQQVEKGGRPPSLREIGAHFGIGSLRGVTVHLDSIERKGYIVREEKNGTIRILRDVEGRPVRLAYVEAT